MNQTNAKICIRCKQDCADKPRSRDSAGQYICGACLAVHRKRTQGDVPADNKPLPKKGDTTAVQQGVIEIEGFDAMDMGALAKLEAGAPAAVPKGIEFDAPSEPDNKPASGRKCPSCGYDLRGLKDNKCPECGTLAKGRSSRSHAMEAIRDESRQTARMAYIRPVAIMVFGVIALIVVRMMQSRVDLLPTDAVLYAVRVPVAFLAFCFCAMTFVGSTGTLPLNFLRHMGVCAVMTALFAFFNNSMRTVPLVVMAAVYVLFTYEELDLDLNDAWIVAVISLVAMSLATLAFTYYMN